MGKRPPRDPSTRVVLSQIHSRRRRRRYVGTAAAVLSGLALLAVFTAAAIVTMSDEEITAVVAGPSTTGALAAVPATGDARTVTTPGPPPRPSTTERTTTTATGGPSAAGDPKPAADERPAATTTSATAAPPAAPAPNPIGVVTIDPGHQARGNTSPEPVGPGSSRTKPKVSGGTRGVTTGTPEHELVLAVGLELRRQLEARNVEVVMTRTSADVDISNAQRTEIANRAGSDLYIRIHADGSSNSSRSGVHVLYPASVPGWTDDIAAASKRAAQTTQRHLVAATGAKDLGVQARDDITGFNWSDVPVILPEIGFMTHAQEDRLLATAEYRRKIASALAAAAVEFIEG